MPFSPLSLLRLTSGGPRDFGLLRFFMTASLIAFLVVALLLGYIFRTLSIDGLIHGYETAHVSQAQIIANEMWERDFVPLLQGVKQTPAELQNSAQTQAVHRKVLNLLRGTKIFKIKVYDLEGRTLYSTELRQIGQEKANNPGVASGLRGFFSSQLVHRDQFSAFEGEVQNRDLVESYIPRYDPVTRRVSGVFEIYGDATAVLAEIGRRQWTMVGVVVGLLSLLYLALFAIVKRAQDLIALQNQQREQAQAALAQSEERWKFALEGSGDGVWDRNLQSGEVVFSKRYREIYGFSEGDLTQDQQRWDARVHPDDLDAVRALREAYFSGQKASYSSEHRMQCKDGSWKWILSRGMVVSRDAQGRPLRMIGTHTDISARHEREEALLLASTVFHTMDEAVTITNADNLIVSVNPAFTAITGYSAAEVIGMNPRLLASGVHPPEFYRDMWTKLGSVGAWRGEIQNRAKSGRLYVEWLSIKRVMGELGLPSHYVAVFSDISERKASEERLQQLAHFDVLTGLPNRALFSDRLHQTLASARRNKARVAVMFIDLDKFKPVNDELGHQVGDQLLREVAQRLSQVVRRESDTVGRLGGDEFVVTLSDVESTQDALAVAEKILADLNRPFLVGAHVLGISSCIGVALFPEHGLDENQLLKRADVAMYQAKEAGANQVRLAQTPTQ